LKKVEIDKGTFKYHMTLRGEGLAQTVRVPLYGEREDLAKLSCNFYSGLKSLIHSSSCFIFGICGGGGWL